MKNSVVLVMVVLFLFTMVAQIQAADKAIALKSMSSGVYYNTAGDDMVLPEGQTLNFEDKFELRTDESGKAMVNFYDEAKMILKSSSDAKISYNSLLLRKGDSWLRFVKRGSSFKIKTPSAVLGIRGTTFSLAVDSRGNTTVKLIEGEISVKTNKEDLIMQAGTTVQVSARTGHADVTITRDKPVNEFKSEHFRELQLNEDAEVDSSTLEEKLNELKGSEINVKPIEGLENLIK